MACGVHSNGKEFHMKTKDKSSSKQSSSAGSKQSGNQGSRSGGAQGGTQGGTHEQHVEAGRQSHKNDSKRSTRSR
jgi:hypothetical protein